jgi:hypothetical protein
MVQIGFKTIYDLGFRNDDFCRDKNNVHINSSVVQLKVVSDILGAIIIALSVNYNKVSFL